MDLDGGFPAMESHYARCAGRSGRALLRYRSCVTLVFAMLLCGSRCGDCCIHRFRPRGARDDRGRRDGGGFRGERKAARIRDLGPRCGFCCGGRRVPRADAHARAGADLCLDGRRFRRRHDRRPRQRDGAAAGRVAHRGERGAHHGGEHAPTWAPLVSFSLLIGIILFRPARF